MATNLFRSLVQFFGDDHKNHREILIHALGPNSVTTLQAQMRESAITQLEILGEAGGELDFAKQISAPYPLQVVLDVIGVPRADQPQMLRLTQ